MTEFAEYITASAKQHKISKINVSRITGISESYIYKIMNGVKKTAQRDYVIAMCRAIGLDLKETQNALRLNEMERLSDLDRRDHVIITAILDGLTFRRTNIRLEENGFEELRTQIEEVV